MFTRFTKKFGFGLGCLFALLMFIGVCAVSWTLTCGIVYLITLCFGWAFNWAWATGVWLVIWLLNSIFSKAK